MLYVAVQQLLLRTLTMRGKTYAIAAGGVLSGMAIALMLLGSIIPLATFVSPALAAICVLYFCLAFSNRMALAVYIVISVLTLLLAADKELALVFTFIIGYYPVLKMATEKLKSRLMQWVIKFGVFNLTSIGLYYILINVFIVSSVREEFAEYTTLLLIVLLLLANATLFFYDRVLTKLAILYEVKLKPKLEPTR